MAIIKNKSGFTLIEIMVGILIFSIVITAGFKALTAVNIGKIKLIETTKIEKEAFFFSEKLFELIKFGGTIDYEEYFNRKVVNIDKLDIYSSGHYLHESGYGNFGRNGNIGAESYGEGLYYCLSGNGISMGTGGCFENTRNNNLVDYSGIPQRFGEYSLQFKDHNSNQDDDFGNEDGIGDFIGDDDDESLGIGPSAFSGSEVKELYLINSNNDKRTLFRWNVSLDPDSPSTTDCDFSDAGNPIGEGCLGNIQFLKLDGKDWGFSHDKTGTGLYDGLTDTWIYNEDFSSNKEIAGSIINSDLKRVNLFPDTINIKDFKLQLFPNKDIKYSWKDYSEESNISPYLRINFTMSPSWKKRKGIQGKVPEVKIATTISLNDKLTK